MSWVISSFAFMSQAYTGNMPLLYDGWSLEYEMLFYCVFSMALLIKRLDGTVLAAASAMLLFGLVSGHMIVMEFIYGMLLGLIKQRYTKPPVAPLFALLIGLVCIYFAGIRALYGDEYRAWSFGLPAMLVVFWGIYDKQWPADALSKLGDASYSIYLVQVFTVSGWYKLATKLDVPHWDFVLGAGCVVGTVILGIFIHSYVEKPLTLLLLPLKSWIHAKVQPSLSR
jgi:exopolysaccharide production protein ExoZ